MRGSGRTTKQLTEIIEKVKAGESHLFVTQQNNMRQYVWRLLLEKIVPAAAGNLDVAERNSFSLSFADCDGRLSIQTLSLQADRWRGVRLDGVTLDHSVQPDAQQWRQIEELDRNCVSN